MSKAEGTTVGAPRPTQEELETRLLQAEHVAIDLRLAISKATLRDVIEETRRDMMKAESFFRAIAEVMWDKIEAEDNPSPDFYESLHDTMELYANMLKERINLTDSSYMDKLPRGKP
ncbi:MAG: hypothetical protein IH827_03995 [Myxococcales bacterium]|nr:hypothetical protein [Myxococcales bacterium]